MNIFGGMKNLWIFFFFWGGGSSQNWTIFRGHLYAFKGFFLRPRYGMGVYLGVAKISNIFGMLEIPDIFGGEW